jgi:hypothetical protein
VIDLDFVARAPIVGESTAPPVILVGEANPYFAGHGDPSYSLYCYPIGSAGHRLRKILGLPQHRYLALYRVNLCDGDWSNARAQDRARALIVPSSPWRVVVLLGRKVTGAFEKVALGGDPLVPFATRTCVPGMTFISLPHPSGRNLIWNQPWARERARQLLRTLAPDLPWGSADAEEARA